MLYVTFYLFISVMLITGHEKFILKGNKQIKVMQEKKTDCCSLAHKKDNRCLAWKISLCSLCIGGGYFERSSIYLDVETSLCTTYCLLYFIFISSDHLFPVLSLETFLTHSFMLLIKHVQSSISSQHSNI